MNTGVPSIWTLTNMTFPGNSIVGGSYPGVPQVLIGRNKHFSWGLTAAMTDVSDLYLEHIKGNKYMVDDKWRNLDV